jgi:HK97 family phage major capsid protein
MKTEAQKRFEALRQQAQDIENQHGDSVWPAEAVKTYQGIVEEAKQVRQQIEAQDVMKQAKSWAEQSSGSAVRSGFLGEILPNEGNIDGVTDDGTGELADYKGVGKQKLAALKSGAYKDAFAQHTRMKAIHGPDWRSHMKAEHLKILQEGADESGGFWVPPDNRTEVVKKIATMAAVRPNATVITTGSDLVSFPTVKYTSDQKYTSGVRFGWNGEVPAANISESTNPIAGRDTIPVHVATAAIFLSRSMMEDGQFDVLGYITELMAEAFGLGEEDTFWTGAGDGRPEGITKHTQASVAHGTGDGMYVASGHASALTWGGADAPTAAVTKGILGIEGALPPQYESNAKWYANKGTYSSIRGLTDSQKRPLWQTTDAPGLTNYVRGLPQTLLGYDVMKSQFVPDIAADALALAFGDMKGYYIADRVGMSVEVFREVFGLRDLVVVYARKRLGAKLMQPWRMKLLKIAA